MKESPYAVSSILKNKTLPDKICVNVLERDIENIPKEFYKNDLIEINIIPEDLKCHNKYYYTALKYPNDVIILIDDDIIYEDTFMDECIDFYVNNKTVVGARRVHEILVKDGNIAKYSRWKRNVLPDENTLIFFTTGGGTVFPPGVLSKYVSLEDIKEYIYADDILLNYICRKNGIEIKWIKNSRKFNDITILKNKFCLCPTNILFRNDLYIKKIKFKEYLNYETFTKNTSNEETTT